MSSFQVYRQADTPPRDRIQGWSRGRRPDTPYGTPVRVQKLLGWILCSASCVLLTAFLPTALPAASAPTTQAEAPEWTKPPDFMYSPQGKPDPFHPIIQTAPTEPSPEDELLRSLSPLERVQPSQLKLVGILSRMNGQRQAMVELPNGKGYILQAGASIGRRQGKVTAITSTTVVIQETVVNVFGKKMKQDTILKLHQQGEQPDG